MNKTHNLIMQDTAHNDTRSFKAYQMGNGDSRTNDWLIFEKAKQGSADIETLMMAYKEYCNKTERTAIPILWKICALFMIVFIAF